MSITVVCLSTATCESFLQIVTAIFYRFFTTRHRKDLNSCIEQYLDALKCLLNFNI